MCGIFGQITPGRPVDPIACLAAVNSMRHRGPDGLGIAAGRLARQAAEFARDPESGTVAARCARSHADFFLGHRRLAVVDLAEAACQPMANEDGTVWVVFNGEVYNHQSLRETLAARGHHFKTDHSDTEALVHGYEQWGEQLLDRLRGMFALAVLDLGRRRLLLARDRFGEKPLYYRRHAGGIAFASEIKALAALAEVKREVNPAALVDYVSHGFIPAPRTILAGVFKLRAAEAIMLRLDDPEQAQPRRYWGLKYLAEDHRSESFWQEEFDEELGRAVRMRLMSDVPLGLFLSGGLDSTTVAAEASRAAAEPLHSFSIGFADPRYDESPWADQAAARFHTEHHRRIVSPSDLLDGAEAVAGIFDEPFADSSAVPTYLVARLAREHVTVALSGDGGDELLAGYARYAFLERIGRLVDRFPCWMVRALGAPLRFWPEQLRGRGLADMILPGLEARYRRVFCDDGLRGQMRLEARCDWRNTIPEAWNDEGGSAIDRMCSMDRQVYIPEDLMVKVDRTSMHVSLEARAPLLDHKLFELAARMPLRLRFDGRVGKLPFRGNLARLVGSEFVDRPKRGFSVPLGRWFRHELRGPVRDAVLRRGGIVASLFPGRAVRRLLDGHERGSRDQSPRLWKLLMLDAWERKFQEAAALRPAAPLQVPRAA